VSINANAHILLGKAYLNLKDYESALEHLLKVIEFEVFKKDHLKFAHSFVYKAIS
jgi:tetratricopeptide (TPR) repeat protein